MATKLLIDANALEKLIRTNAKVEANDTQYDIGRVHGLINSADLIHNAPTVDAVEVVHGEWVQIGYDKAMDRISCSVCKESWNILDNNTETFNYCPNCGADMRGDGNG